MLPDLRPATFAAMGGTVELQLVGDDDGRADRVAAVFANHEHALSRFLDGSELRSLNAAAPAAFVASPLLFGAVRAALRWAEATDGVFDPTVIDALESLGYDRSFDEIAGDYRCGPSVPFARGRWRLAELDARTRAIRLPQDVRLDLGGIGKGHTVDRAIAALGCGTNAIVNASGDLYAAGAGPDGDGWLVGVEDPRAPDRDIAVLRVVDRGVATSGATRRHWMSAGRRYHHLLDSRTGLPFDSDALAVTVVAATAEAADVLAKCVYLSGIANGFALAERCGVDVLAIDAAGAVQMSAGMQALLA